MVILRWFVLFITLWNVGTGTLHTSELNIQTNYPFQLFAVLGWFEELTGSNLEAMMYAVFLFKIEIYLKMQKNILF